ncbi:hypothetical protein [Longimicrobium sp.]|uniref:hypothetical protein n=1 Tax=Longimicrobium sp. TaxID=2029185 RepID=UPI002E32EE27|nr:hypothetical protein [Longimicrobium sp.]HEX6041702.1 hypothetical protein [Longimicrobium sp.]
MTEKMRAMLDRAVQQANQRMTAIQKGQFHPRIDVVRQGGPVEPAGQPAKNAA